MSLGDLIDRELNDRNWSGRDLSARTYEVADGTGFTGIEPSTVSELRRGIRTVRIETLYIVAQAFATPEKSVGTWMTQLIRAAGYPLGDGTVPAREIDGDLEHELSRLTADQQAALRVFLRQLRT